MILKQNKEFEVLVAGEKSPQTLKSIWISELGFVMVSLHSRETGATTNYNIGKVSDILPEKIRVVY